MSEYRYKPTKARSRDRLSLKVRTAKNETHKCYHPGCKELRYSVSRFCRYHRDKVSRGGHPTMAQPTGAAWKTLLSDGEARLAQLDAATTKRLDTFIGIAARK